MRKKLIWIAPLAIVAMVGFVALGGEVVRLLWNWLLPELFGWREITFWQALGILALCRILFGRWGGYGPRSSMRRRIAERRDAMTPEERERFRDAMRRRCGFGPEPSGSQGQSS
jgi:hypothetical protein